ncbi:MAG: hypothetical protein ACRDTG_22050 [Pseudonocardiaceae bacterium]
MVADKVVDAFFEVIGESLTFLAWSAEVSLTISSVRSRSARKRRQRDLTPAPSALPGHNSLLMMAVAVRNDWDRRPRLGTPLRIPAEKELLLRSG